MWGKWGFKALATPHWVWSDRWAGAYGQLSLRYLALHLSSSFLQAILHNKCHRLCLQQISSTCAHSYIKEKNGH